MKFAFPLIALALALLAGCTTPQSASSASRLVIPASAVGKNPSWSPSTEEITALEEKLATLLTTPDQRVFGLGQNLPPHPLSAYLVRYTAAGPLDNKFIMGAAALPTTVPADRFLSPDTADTEAVELSTAPSNFQFIYNLKQQRVVEIRFNKQPATP
jgi:hypothetical protein